VIQKAADENPDHRQAIEILLREYDQRRTEIVSLMGRYAKQEQTLTIYLTIIAILTLALLAVDLHEGTIYIPGYGLMKLPAQVRNHASTFVVTVLSGGALIAFYFISGLMEIVYWSQALTARAAAIETEINSRIGQRLLTWDSVIVPEIISEHVWRDGPFLMPALLLGIWAVAIFAATTVLLSLICYVLVRAAFWFWAPAVWVLVIYHILAWSWLTTARKSDVFDWIVGLASFGSSQQHGFRASALKRSVRERGQRLMQVLNSHAGMIVSAATLLLGFVPFAVLSLRTASFWPHSKVSVPLTLVPSVLIGDSLILPFFNRSTYSLVVALLKKVSRLTKVRLLVGGLACIATCTPVIAYEHLLWIRDEYTGFIDNVPGHLSVAGVWHAAFATIETAVIVWFLGVSLIWAKDQERLPRKQLLRTWKMFLFYASLSVLDFVVKKTHLALAATPLRLEDIIALSPILLAIMVYLILRQLSMNQTDVSPRQ
jgi:hypothetical protein